MAAYYEPCADRRSIESCWKSIATDIFPIACMSSTKLDVIRWSNDVHIDRPFLLKNFSCIGCFVIESDISPYFFHKIHLLLWASRRNDSTSSILASWMTILHRAQYEIKIDTSWVRLRSHGTFGPNVTINSDEKVWKKKRYLHQLSQKLSLPVRR